MAKRLYLAIQLQSLLYLYLRRKSFVIQIGSFAPPLLRFSYTLYTRKIHLTSICLYVYKLISGFYTRRTTPLFAYSYVNMSILDIYARNATPNPLISTCTNSSPKFYDRIAFPIFVYFYVYKSLFRDSVPVKRLQNSLTSTCTCQLRGSMPVKSFLQSLISTCTSSVLPFVSRKDLPVLLSSNTSTFLRRRNCHSARRRNEPYRAVRRLTATT